MRLETLSSKLCVCVCLSHLLGRWMCAQRLPAQWAHLLIPCPQRSRNGGKVYWTWQWTWIIKTLFDGGWNKYHTSKWVISRRYCMWCLQGASMCRTHLRSSWRQRGFVHFSLFLLCVITACWQLGFSVLIITDILIQFFWKRHKLQVSQVETESKGSPS